MEANNNAYIGRCAICGQTRVTPPTCAHTEDEADVWATMNCSCKEGEDARRQMTAKKRISEMFPELDGELKGLLYEITEYMRQERLGNTASIKLPGDVIAKIKSGANLVNIKRVEKKEQTQTL